MDKVVSFLKANIRSDLSYESITDQPLWLATCDIIQHDAKYLDILIEICLESGLTSAPNGALLVVEFVGNCAAEDFKGLQVGPTVGLFRYLLTHPGRSLSTVVVRIPSGCESLRLGVRTWYAKDSVSIVNFALEEEIRVDLVDTVVDTSRSQEAIVDQHDGHHTFHSFRIPSKKNTFWLKTILQNRSTTSKWLVVILPSAELKGTTKRSVFHYIGILDDINASLLYFTDPGLEISDDITASWFIPNEHFDTLTAVKKTVQYFCASLNIRDDHVIFLGSSAGGFAALLISWHFSKSFAVAMLPQIRLTDYKPFCDLAPKLFPSLSDRSEIRSIDLPFSDLEKIYKEKFENTVIYISNSTDYLHRRYMSSFISNFAEQQNLLLDVGFWGKFGHSIVPRERFSAWIRSVIESDDKTPHGIWRKFHTLTSSSAVKQDTSNSKVTQSENNYHKITDKVLKYHKRQACVEVDSEHK